MRLAYLILISAVFLKASTISIPGNAGDSLSVSEQDAGDAIRSLGQVFVVPTPTNEFVLTTFSFTSLSASSGIDYRGYVYEWDSVNSRAKGPALYTSEARMGAEVPSFFGLSLALSSTAQYIAFVTTQGVVNDSISDFMLLQGNGNDPYIPGSAYLQSSGLSFANTVSGSWAVDPWVSVGTFDLQFEATFDTGIPEPSTVGLAALGVLGMAVRCLRRRRQVTPR